MEMESSLKASGSGSLPSLAEGGYSRDRSNLNSLRSKYRNFTFACAVACNLKCEKGSLQKR